MEVNPTEDLEKVKAAVENVLGRVEFEVVPLRRGSLLRAKARGLASLTKLYNLLRRERIRDAARRALLEGMSENSITFHLNKQVAYVGHVSFCEPSAESPLGPIKIHVRCENPRELIDWLAPKTR